MSPIPATTWEPRRASSAGGAVSQEARDPLADIGTHLRNARLQRGLSLREMARRVGVSPSFVSQVELGKTKPSLGTLYGFLSELDLSLDELMPPAQVDSVPSRPDTSRLGPTERSMGVDSLPHMWTPQEQVCQPWDDHPLVQLKGVTWRRLTSDDPLVDFLHVTYEPGSESCPDDHLMRHEGHEYGHIISGALRVKVAFEVFDLGPGDAINFPSTTPHRLSNEGPDACCSIWVVVGRRSTYRVSWPALDENGPSTT